MRMTHGVLFTAGVLSGAMAIRAQEQQPALQGLPQYGVTLTGTLENPVLENHSGRVVICYDVKFSDANGLGMTQNLVMAISGPAAGIPDGGSVYVKGALPINPTVPVPSPPTAVSAGQGPMVTAILRSVIFADGQFVGADEEGTFEELATKLKAITEVGMMAKTQGWSPIEALAQAFVQRPQAPPPSFVDYILTISRQVAALRLVQTRKSKGEPAADQLAQIYRSLPTLWK
jgi:hypothetical protein